MDARLEGVPRGAAAVDVPLAALNLSSSPTSKVPWLALRRDEPPYHPVANLLLTRFEDIGSWANLTRVIWPRAQLACDSNVHVKTRDGDYEAFARLHTLDAENRAALALCDTWRFYT